MLRPAILLLPALLSLLPLRPAAAQAPPRAYFTAAGRRTASPDSAAYYTLTQRQGAGGTVTTYRPDGRRLHRETYSNLAASRLHGPSTSWTDGRRTALLSYQRGQLHGLAQSWYPDGRRRWQLPYQRGQRHGAWRVWNAAGQLIRLETYRRGQLIGRRCFTAAGHDTAYFEPNQPAGFEGGAEALQRWVKQELKYPALALRNQVEGRVFVRFRIDEQGRVQAPRVRKGIGAGCDEAALRVVEKMPRWRPAWREGLPAASEYELPLEFYLQ
ncbi:TonB family protein [Hymenobacter gummosus]|uniref:TonB family protein n=1 Tax=Hymenobacter gummosus TaxID=1776032 RepID=A0A3S0H0J3_9BACT|nr:energy transducer TonB [Hymenobacter gummosus]RTQ44871.1 TonB family protein [Hymenobacter gummosus]